MSKWERKTFAFKLDDAPDDEGRFTGYAAVFGNVDQGNDVIEAGAFTKTLQENPVVPILWAHNSDEPIGVSATLAEDSKGLRFEGQLDLNVQRAREIHSLMKMGAVRGVSIGYRTVKRSYKGAIRHLQELRLGEFSPCVFPMNELAQVDGVKYESWEGVDAGVCSLLSMIRCGTEFMVEEVAEGDTADAGRMQSILSSLAKLLASELAEIAAGDDGASVEDIYAEAMSETVARATKQLEALLTLPEPAEATPEAEEAASDAAEPESASTLRDLTASMRRGH